MTGKRKNSGCRNHATQSKKQDTDWHNSTHWEEAQHILEILSSLNYHNGQFKPYLKEITGGVCELLGLDWSVVTFCREDREQVMASSLDIGEGEHIYALHGTLTGTVFKTGKTLAVENAKTHPEYGEPPKGYTSYLGIPLRTSQGEVFGTLCSFCILPRQFSPTEVRIAELFAERAAIALDNYLLYQQKCEFNQFLEAEVARRTEELKLAQVQLIERERLAAIGEFAASIVHEIRNPMTTILMGLTALQSSCQSERDRSRLSLALDESRRLQNLLAEILLFAKPQALQQEAIEVSSAIAQMLDTLKEMPETAERQIIFLPAAETVKIMGDRDKLKQVLINLIRNACEAIAPGETVTCAVECDRASVQVCLRVHNGGTPIPPEILPKLTQPFYTNKPGGTGLGLAVVKRVVEGHGGTLLIESDATAGTTVTVLMPAIFS